MNFSLDFHISVRDDLQAAINWFTDINLELVDRLIEESEFAIDKIKTNPQHYSHKYKNVRILKLETFDYGIHYVIKKQRKVYVLAFLHGKQSRDKSVERINS